MAKPEIHQFPCRSDNYGVLVHCTATGATASIDAPDGNAVRRALEETGWQLTHILTTHHHGDHVEGNIALKKATGCTIIGPRAEAETTPGIDEAVAEGDRFRVGDIAVEVLETPGHTAGHVSYVLPDAKIAFVGDTLFAAGCGKLLEGSPETMWDSLQKLAALPDETEIYCGHEYTVANIRFALTVEPGNIALQARAKEAKALRDQDQPTVPSMLAEERATNPFLRPDSPEIRERLGMPDAAEVEVFAELRRRKDRG